jgi:hypothetical protein
MMIGVKRLALLAVVGAGALAAGYRYARPANAAGVSYAAGWNLVGHAAIGWR